jgi:hypothetical protein
MSTVSAVYQSTLVRQILKDEDQRTKLVRDVLSRPRASTEPLTITLKRNDRTGTFVVTTTRPSRSGKK